MDRIIFLDFDGVLNSVRSAVGLGGYGCMPRKAKTQSLSNVMWHNETLLDFTAMCILRRIIEETGCKIVVSSTWRFGCNVSMFNSLFKAYGLPEVVVDMTPALNEGVRGHEIEYFIGKYGVKDYFILDDDSDMLFSQMANFIKVDAEFGLSRSHYEIIKARWVK